MMRSNQPPAAARSKQHAAASPAHPLWMDAPIAVLVLLCAIGGLLAPAASSAQTLRGVLRDAQTGTPIAGAFVTLRDSAGATITAGLADSAGTFRFRAPRHATYAVHAERLGYESFTSDVFVIDGDSVALEFRIAVQAIHMPPIAVEASLQCRGREDLVEAGAVIWEEARKALQVAAWTNTASLIRYEVLEVNRTFNRSLKVTKEQKTKNTITRERSPFMTPPAARVLHNGFIQLRRTLAGPPTEALYYGPDADIFLSDEFQRQYCFRTVSGEERDGLVGLAFEERVYRSTIGINGVLWIDAKSFELVKVDFGYSHLPWEVDVAPPRGTVEFQRLPDGLVIVDRWSIFAPTVTRRASRNPNSALELRGYTEAGREVTAAFRADGSAVPLRRR